MTVAVVTPVAGRTDHLVRLLDGLAGQLRPADEIVVVDLAPGDPAVRECTVRARIRRLPLPPDASGSLPLAAARNLGAASTDCDVLVFLDADCIPAPDLIARYEDGVRRRPRALVCGPVRYLRPDWLDGLPGNILDVDHLAASSEHPAARPRPETLIDGDDHELFWSLSFGVASSTWASIGGFDPGYVGYGAEDTDFAMRARAAGVRMAWMPDGVAFHQWHPPSRLDPARLGELVANARRFRDRWGWWPMSGWLEELHQLGALRFAAADDVLHVHV